MTNPIADPLVEGRDTDALSPLVLLEAGADGVATVVLNRPARNNALNPEMIAALKEVFETLEGADGVRVIFLTGAGGVFCAGGDPYWLAGTADHTDADNREDALAMALVLRRLQSLPALTVALVEGEAIGGGAGLATACDLAVATADARFGFPEVRSGLIAATVSPYVVAAVGARRARGLFATGRAFDAAHARDIGLIDEVVEGAAGLMHARERIIAQMAACAPGAVTASKLLVAHVAGHRLDHALAEDTARRNAEARAGEEGREGILALTEGRLPAWSVR